MLGREETSLRQERDCACHVGEYIECGYVESKVLMRATPNTTN